VGVRLADGAYRAWQLAQIECEVALAAWRLAGHAHAAAAHDVYAAALDREADAARDFQELCRVTGALLKL
jgi:hypothetical protein